MPTDLSFWAAVTGILVAVVTLASFLGGYFALRKQVQQIDDRLGKVTEVLPDLARKGELRKLSADIQGLRIANEGMRAANESMRTTNESLVQNVQLAVQQFTGILTIITKIQAEVSAVRRDVDDLKSKTRGA